VLKRASRNKDVGDIPDVRADDPERAMEQFTNGLRKVLAAQKHPSAKVALRRGRRCRSSGKTSR